MEHNSVEQMLIYAVEMLGSEAFHILSRVGNVIDLKDTTNLRHSFSSINFSSTRKAKKKLLQRNCPLKSVFSFLV
jgi:hypothetical protein